MEELFVDYLKSRQLKPLMTALKKQYLRLSKLSGTIEIIFSNQDEIDALSLFLNEDYYDVRNSVKLPVSKLRKRIEQTSYAQVDLVKVIEVYFSETLITKKEVTSRENERSEQVKHVLEERYANTSVGSWLFHDCNTISGKIVDIAKINIDSIFLILDAIANIPFFENKQQSLALYATKYTKDPHFFDNGFSFTVLINYLGFLFDIRTSQLNLIEKNELLLRGGLLKEGILNFCTVFQLQANTYEGQVHKGLEHFATTGESVNLHLKNIVQIDVFFGFEKVLIIENPSVFQVIQEWLYENKYNDIALICSHGEINFATYHLIDKLVHADIKILYAGDFDPEGILIAQRMKNRYKDKVVLLCYQTKFYLKAMSDKHISDIRLMKLQNCNASCLQEIKQLVIENRKCAYQEALIEDYIAVLNKDN